MWLLVQVTGAELLRRLFEGQLELHKDPSIEEAIEVRHRTLPFFSMSRQIMHLQRRVMKAVADWRKLWLVCLCVQQMNLLAWSMADDSSSSDRSQDETRAQVSQRDRSSR